LFGSDPNLATLRSATPEGCAKGSVNLGSDPDKPALEASFMNYEPFALSLLKGFDKLNPNGNLYIIGPDQ